MISLHCNREVSRDREFSRDMTSNGDVPSGKSKFVCTSNLVNANIFASIIKNKSR